MALFDYETKEKPKRTFSGQSVFSSEFKKDEMSKKYRDAGRAIVQKRLEGYRHPDIYTQGMTDNDYVAIGRKEAKEKEPGVIKAGVSAVARGIPALGELAGHAIKTLDPEGGIDVVEKVGQKIIDVSEGMRDVGIMRPPTPGVEEEGFVRRGIMGGLESAIPSLAPVLAGAGAGAVVGSVVPGVGTVIGGIVGAIGATLGIHGLGVYGQKKEEYTQQGIDEKTAHGAAIKQGLIEGGIETVSNLIGMVTFGWGKLATQPLKTTAKELLKTPVKTFAKNLTKNALLNEVPTEMIQGALGAKVDEEIGLLPEGAWQEAAVESIIPALTMSVLFGVGAQGITSLQRNSVKNQLNSEKPEERKKAAEYIAKNIDDKELRQAWAGMVEPLIDSGAPIDINADFTQTTSEETGIFRDAVESGQLAEDIKSGEVTIDDMSPVIEKIATQDPALATQITEMFAAEEVEPVGKPISAARDTLLDTGEKGITAKELLTGKALTPEEKIKEAARVFEEAPRRPAEISAEIFEEKITEEKRIKAKAEIEPDINKFLIRGYKPGEVAIPVEIDKEGKGLETTPDQKRLLKGMTVEEAQTAATQWNDLIEPGMRDVERKARIAEAETLVKERPDLFNLVHGRLNVEDPAKIEAQIQEVDISPTEAQIEAGNYKKAHIKVQGFDISIENPEGSTRSGVSPEGKKWSITMSGGHYGYFKRSEGKDGEQIDVFVNADDRRKSDKAYIVDQVDPETGKFDEHKAMVGYPSLETASEGYLANYEKGWKGLGNITEVSMDDLKTFVEKRQTRPYAEIKKPAIEVKPEVKELVKPEKIPAEFVGMQERTGKPSFPIVTELDEGKSTVTYDPEKHEITVKKAEYEKAVAAKPLKPEPPKPAAPEAAREEIKAKPIPKVAPKIEKTGFAWISGKQKPVLSARGITKGKNKGKYEVVLTKGRDEEGNIIPGAKKIVTEKDIITMPEEKVEIAPIEKAKIIKPVIPGVKPVIEEKIEVTPTPEGKEITVDLTKKEEAAVTPMQQKEYLLAEIDKAIEGSLKEAEVESVERARELLKMRINPLQQIDTVFRFEVPNDGTFEIIGSELFDFQKRVESAFPSTIISKKFKPKVPAKKAVPVAKYKEILDVAPEKLKPKDIDRIFEEVADTEVKDLTGAVLLNPFQNWLLSQDISEAVRNKIKSVADKDYIAEAFEKMEAQDIEYARAMVQHTRDEMEGLQSYYDEYKTGKTTLKKIAEETGIKRSGNQIEQALQDATQAYEGAIGHFEKLTEIKPLFLIRKPYPLVSEASVASELQGHISKITARWKNAPIVEVVQSQSELPKEILKYSEGQIVDGVYFRGKVYIVADNQASPETAVKTLLHESFGHFGLRSVLGKEFGDIMDKVYSAKEPAIQTIADNYGFDTGTYKGKALAAEEWLSREAVTNPESNWVNKVVALIRKFMRKIMPSLKMADAEIRQLIQDARSYVEIGKPRATRGISRVPGFQMAGVRAAEAPMATLFQAETMLKEGKSKEEVWKETGWLKGVEGEQYSWLKLTKKPSIPDRTINSMSPNAKFFSDLLVSKAFQSKNFDGLDVPTKRMVIERVFAVLHNSKIRDSIIKRIPVNVMDYFSGKQLATRDLFNNMPMLSNLLSVNADNTISIPVNIADSIVKSVATTVAEESKPLFPTSFTKDLLPAIVTDKRGRLSIFPLAGTTTEKKAGFTPLNSTGRDMEFPTTRLAFNFRHDDPPFAPNIFDNIKGVKDKPRKDVWKFEIDDSAAKLDVEKFIKGTGRPVKLYKILEHPLLFKAYPSLMNLEIIREDNTKFSGSYNEYNNRIKIGGGLIANHTIKETLFHEIQHAIQKIEGFAEGGAPAMFKGKAPDFDIIAQAKELRTFAEKNNLTIDEVVTKPPRHLRHIIKQDAALYLARNKTVFEKVYEKALQSQDPHKSYRRLAGEIEARDTAARAKLTPEQRRAQLPYRAEGIPEDQWIIKKGEGTSFSVEEPPAFAKRKPPTDYKELLKKYKAPVKAPIEKPLPADEDIIKTYKEKHIAFEPKKLQLTKQVAKDFIAKVYTKFVFTEFPALRLAAKAKDPKVTQRIQDQINKVWGKGGIVEVFVAGKGPHRYDEGGKPEYIEGSQSLKEIVKDLSPQEYEDYETLRIAERDIALATFRSDIKGTDIEASSQVVKALEKKYGDNIKKLRDVSKEQRKYDDTLLKLLVEEGWLSKKVYEGIKAKPESEFYASFLREMDTVGEQVHGGKDPLKKIKGSELRKIPTIESSVSNTYKTVKLLETIKLNKKIVELKDLTPDLAEVIEEVQPQYITKDMPKRPGPRGGTKVSIRSPIQPKGTIIVPVDGVKHYWRVPPDVHKAIDYYSPQEMSMAIKILSGPARLLRAGATLTAEFIMRNPVRDQFSAMVYSKYGYIPFIDFGKGFFELMKKGDLYQEFKAGGGEQSYFTSMDRTTLNLTARDILGFKKGLKTYNPIEYLRIASEAMEKSTRLGVFKRAKDKGATTSEATAAARESTLDFRRIGEERRINQIIAFWNANVQGTDILRRKLQKHPGQTLLRLTLGITLPSIALWLFNNSDDERKERYNALPGWRKNFFWNIILDKDMPIISLPKPFELGLIFGSLPERILDYIALNDPKELETIAQSIKEGTLPGIIPTAALPIIENMTNWSFFMKRPIESETIKRLPPGQRAHQYTSSVLREVGKITDLSPLKMENWVRGWSGGLGKLGLDIIDPLFETDKVPEVTKDWYRVMPGIRGFISREPIGSAGKDITNFYDNLQRANEAEQGFKVLIKTDRDEAIKFDEKTKGVKVFAKPFRKQSLALGKLRKRKAVVMGSKTLSSDRKRDLIETIDTRMSLIAKTQNERFRKFLVGD